MSSFIHSKYFAEDVCESTERSARLGGRQMLPFPFLLKARADDVEVVPEERRGERAALPGVVEKVKKRQMSLRASLYSNREEID